MSPTEHADDLLLSLQPDIIDMEKWNTHDITWSFGGCSQQAMDAAALPWTLDMTSPSSLSSWGGAADPYRDGTITTTHESRAGVLDSELDRFVKFYPGGLDAMLADVEKINNFGGQAQRVKTRSARKNDVSSRHSARKLLGPKNGRPVLPTPAVSRLRFKANDRMNRPMVTVFLSYNNRFANHESKHPKK